MIAQDIINIMEKHFPLDLQEEWDKCGIQVGNPKQEIHKIMISLDCDVRTMKECIDKGCDMLITHHPLLLDPITHFSYNTPMGEFLSLANKNDVVVYSSHTAMDHQLMNVWLMECLDVKDIQVGDPSGITRVATLNKPMNQQEFLNHVKLAYGLEHFQYAGDVKEIKRIALCGGSGADMMSYFYDCDAYITGDTKYRHAKEAIDHQLLLVDVHHHVENIMVSKLKSLLEKEVNVEIIEGSSPDYFHYI